MAKDYYLLELDDMVIALQNKDSQIEDLEAEIAELEEKVESLRRALADANKELMKYVWQDVNKTLEEEKGND